MILDYSHYIEMVEQEEMGVHDLQPTGVTKSLNAIGATAETPIRFFPGELGTQIHDYVLERVELFGPARLLLSILPFSPSEFLPNRPQPELHLRRDCRKRLHGLRLVGVLRRMLSGSR